MVLLSLLEAMSHISGAIGEGLVRAISFGAPLYGLRVADARVLSYRADHLFDNVILPEDPVPCMLAGSDWLIDQFEAWASWLDHDIGLYVNFALTWLVNFENNEIVSALLQTGLKHISVSKDILKKAVKCVRGRMFVPLGNFYLLEEKAHRRLPRHDLMRHLLNFTCPDKASFESHNMGVYQRRSGIPACGVLEDFRCAKSFEMSSIVCEVSFNSVDGLFYVHIPTCPLGLIGVQVTGIQSHSVLSLSVADRKVVKYISHDTGLYFSLEVEWIIPPEEREDYVKGVSEHNVYLRVAGRECPIRAPNITAKLTPADCVKPLDLVNSSSLRAQLVVTLLQRVDQLECADKMIEQLQALSTLIAYPKFSAEVAALSYTSSWNPFGSKPTKEAHLKALLKIVECFQICFDTYVQTQLKIKDAWSNGQIAAAGAAGAVTTVGVAVGIAGVAVLSLVAAPVVFPIAAISGGGAAVLAGTAGGMYVKHKQRRGLQEKAYYNKLKTVNAKLESQPRTPSHAQEEEDRAVSKLPECKAPPQSSSVRQMLDKLSYEAIDGITSFLEFASSWSVLRERWNRTPVVAFLAIDDEYKRRTLSTWIGHDLDPFKGEERNRLPTSLPPIFRGDRVFRLLDYPCRWGGDMMNNIHDSLLPHVTWVILHPFDKDVSAVIQLVADHFTRTDIITNLFLVITDCPEGWNQKREQICRACSGALPFGNIVGVSSNPQPDLNIIPHDDIWKTLYAPTEIDLQ